MNVAIKICKHCTIVKRADEYGETCGNCLGTEEISAIVSEEDAEIIESGGIGSSSAAEE